MKLSPIKCAQTIVIGVGSEPVRLKCRHDGSLKIEGKIKCSKANEGEGAFTIASLRLGVPELLVYLTVLYLKVP